MRIIYLFAAIILLSASNAAAQSSEFKIPDWLEFVEEIRIPNDQFSGLPGSYGIDNVGNVHFNSDSTPYLYSRRLNQLIKLDPEGCRPGADPRLPISKFTPDGEIVGNFGTSYFWFNLSGKCVHYVIDKTMASSRNVALPGRNMTFVRDRIEQHMMERMDANGNVTLSATIDKLPISNIASRAAGGGIIFSNGRYYWANSRTNTVAAYDVNFSPIWKKEIGLKDLPFVTKDITDQESNEYMTHMPRILKEIAGKAGIGTLSKVDQNTLLLSASYENEHYFQLFDHDGNEVAIYKSDRAFRHNPNSRLFFRVENKEELILYVYRMK